MDGYEVASRLREHERLRDTTLVAITGYGQEEDRRLAREAKLDFHLTKPVDPEALRQLILGASAVRPVLC
jgi:CheY-like chemotaxis protein